ncbi:MAG: hypothetical protein ACTSWW_07930 [Promethearchaeota archaeon]
MVLLFRSYLFATAQDALYPEENVDNLHTRITNIGANIISDSFVENLEESGYNTSGYALFQLSLRYAVWNAGRKIASFTTGNLYALEDIIPLTYSWETLHSGEINFHRNLIFWFAPMVKTYEFSPGFTNDTAVMFLNVTDWTSNSLPLGNYSFQVGQTTWQERLPATLHVESNNTWTEIEELPEGWGVDATISRYSPLILGIGVVVVIGGDLGILEKKKKSKKKEKKKA